MFRLWPSPAMRGSNCSLMVPPSLDALVNSVAFKTVPSRPSSRRIGNSVNSDGDGSLGYTPVVSLLLAACPHAVIGGVIGVIIEPLKGIALKFRPHAVSKSHKVCLPLLADRDASTTIVWVAFMPWIGAALLHVLPSFVQRVMDNSHTSSNTGVDGYCNTGNGGFGGVP